jgi:ferredoxin-NADP reductase
MFCASNSPRHRFLPIFIITTISVILVHCIPDMKKANPISHHKVINIRYLTDAVFVIQVEKGNFSFRSGQHANLLLPDCDTSREYTMYSAEDHNVLEFLVREIPEGFFSAKLKSLKTGDTIQIEAVRNYHFIIGPEEAKSEKFLFVATGTGIAPFHSMVLTHPGLDYRVLHGVAYLRECYDKNTYAPERYISCVSRESGGNFEGRVTSYLPLIELDGKELIYLCGNNNMIMQVKDILVAKGHSESRIFTEHFF